MRSVLLASLRAHTRRYVAALVAITIAVGFVVVTDALASATKNGLSAGVDDAYPNADLIVGDPRGVAKQDVERVLDVSLRKGDRATVVGTAWTPVRSDQRTVGSNVSIGTVSMEPDLRRQEVVAGRAPRSDHEAIADAAAAKSAGVRIGDTITLGGGARRREVRVVGFAGSTAYLSADLYVSWSTLSRLPGAIPQAVGYDVRGDDVAGRAAALRASVGTDVRTRDDYVAERVRLLDQGVDVISYVLLLFAAIAGFVAVLVVTNTFTILFAQRTRDLALLRCVGATRSQVLRSVRSEAAALAVVASIVGVAGGVATGYGAVLLARTLAGPERVGAVDLSPIWLAAAFVGGIATTMLAAWWPTRSVVRVSPLAALRPPEDPGVRTGAGRARLTLGAVTLTGSAAVLALAVAEHAMPLMLLGGMSSFVGVLLLGPVIVPALLRLTGTAVGPIGPSARIAAANAVRQPRRSATTTASLLVGVTLTTAVLTGMASVRGAVGGEMDKQHPVDVALTGTGPVDGATVRQVRATRGVRDVGTVAGVVARADGLDEVPVLAPTPQERRLTRDAPATAAAAGEVLVPPEVYGAYDGPFPDELTLSVDGRTTTLRARTVSREWGRAMVVSPATLATLDGSARPLAVWVRAAAGTDPSTLGGDLGAVVRDSGLDVTNALESRAWVDLQLDVVVYAVIGLLGVGVAIALVGIANTVGLSVLERGREHALLRALGLTRRQLRRVLAAEGLLLASVAAVLGTALGTTYGWLGVLTVVRTAVPDAPLVMPWGQLAAVLVVAALAGLGACVLPARRGAKVAPAAGLTLD